MNLKKRSRKWGKLTTFSNLYPEGSESSLSPHLWAFSVVTPLCDTCINTVTHTQLWSRTDTNNMQAVVTLYLFDLWPGVNGLFGCDRFSWCKSVSQGSKWVINWGLNMQHNSARQSEWHACPNKHTGLQIYLFGCCCCWRNLCLHLQHKPRISAVTKTNTLLQWLVDGWACCLLKKVTS